jgi:hypothetical protein
LARPTHQHFGLATFDPLVSQWFLLNLAVASFESDPFDQTFEEYRITSSALCQAFGG